MDDIIFWGETTCQVVFTFKHAGDFFKVIRKRNRISSTSVVEFYRLNLSNVWIDISGSTSSLTNQEIVDTIKVDAKTFINSAYFRQNDLSEFADSDPSRKKEILKSIIDLSKWDQYEKSAKIALKDLGVELKILNAKLDGFDEAVEQLSTNETLLEKLSSDLKTKQDRSINNQEQVKLLTEKYIQLKSTLDTNKWDETVRRIESLTKDSEKIQQRLKIIDSNLKTYNIKIVKKEQDISDLLKKISELIIDTDVDTKFQLAQNELIEIKSSLSTSKSLLAEKDEQVLTLGSCYVCQQEVTNDLYEKLSHKHQEQIFNYKKNIIFCENKVKELQRKISGLESIRSAQKLKDTFLSRIDSLSSEKALEVERRQELETEQSLLLQELQVLTTKLEMLKGILESIKNNDFKSLQAELNKTKSEQQVLLEETQSLNQSFGILTEKVSSLKEKIAEYSISQKSYLEKQKQAVVFEKMIKLLGKNGVQTILLNAIIEDLEKSANNILSSICNEPFVIFLETQRSGSDGVSVVDTLDLRVKKDGSVQNFKSLSGGEQFRISLALRIALSEICCRHGGSSLEFLLLDEVNSQLDKQGTESLFLNVIKSLEKKYKILIITHNDSLKERFNNIIDVSKKNGESTVNFVSI